MPKNSPNPLDTLIKPPVDSGAFAPKRVKASNPPPATPIASPPRKSFLPQLQLIRPTTPPPPSQQLFKPIRPPTSTDARSEKLAQTRATLEHFCRAAHKVSNDFFTDSQEIQLTYQTLAGTLPGEDVRIWPGASATLRQSFLLSAGPEFYRASHLRDIPFYSKEEFDSAKAIAEELFKGKSGNTFLLLKPRTLEIQTQVIRLKWPGATDQYDRSYLFNPEGHIFSEATASVALKLRGRAPEDAEDTTGQSVSLNSPKSMWPPSPNLLCHYEE